MPASTAFGSGLIESGEGEVEFEDEVDLMETTSIAVAICARRELAVTERASPDTDPAKSRFPMNATGLR